MTSSNNINKTDVLLVIAALYIYWKSIYGKFLFTSNKFIQQDLKDMVEINCHDAINTGRKMPVLV